ncbi:MAG: CRISPR-associated protein Cas4 [Blastocatellia bacterium]|nr:CRISPR-associated protein Cas4 [Blastocatellia bacterium]
MDLTNFTGTEIGYYFVCKKKLWLFSHGVKMEHESDLVKLGKLVHQESYEREKKEINIDDKIVLDWREDGLIHEVKLSDKMENAHEMQLAYYLYFLKKKGVTLLQGKLDYPKLRQTKLVQLTPELEDKLKHTLIDMESIIRSSTPPKVNFMNICRSCSYAELCWG